MDLRHLFEELKRRRVVRAAVGYAAALFVVLQAADIVLPAVGLPDALMTGLVVVGLLGFPLALALAWAVDLPSPGSGRRRDAPEAPPASEREAPARGIAGSVLLLGGALLIVVATAWWAFGSRTAEARPEIRSLAVLPLANQMGDEAQRHFVDGMHDILIGELGRIEGLDVISQRSVLRFRDSDLGIAAIADELGVQAVVEGSVFRQDDSVRVTARLVRGDTETDVWSSAYGGRLSEAMGLQSRVARAVAEEIELALSPTTAEHLARERRIDPAAMDAYLLGRELWKTRDQARMARAVEHLERAVALDPDFALGWAGLADALIWGSAYEAIDLPREEAWERAGEAVERALRIEPGLMEAYAARGGLKLVRQDFRGAERELSRVVELAPSNAQAHNWLGDALAGQGRVEDAVGSYARSVTLDPLSALMRRDYGRALANVGDCHGSMAEAERALELDPQHFYARELIARCQLRLGREAEAVESSIALAEGFGAADHAADLREAWETGGLQVFLTTEARAYSDAGLHVLAASRYAEAGAIDEAFEEIRLGLERREALLFLLRSDVSLDALRDDARWEEILRRLEALPDPESERVNLPG